MSHGRRHSAYFSFYAKAHYKHILTQVEEAVTAKICCFFSVSLLRLRQLFGSQGNDKSLLQAYNHCIVDCLKMVNPIAELLEKNKQRRTNMAVYIYVWVESGRSLGIPTWQMSNLNTEMLDLSAMQT